MNSLRYALLVNVSAISLLLPGCGERDNTDIYNYIAAVKASSAGQELPPLPIVPKAPRFEYTAYEEKDPFHWAEWTQTPPPPPPISKGKRCPDPNRPAEELEKYTLGALAMVGTVRKYPEQGRFAFIKAPDGIVHKVVQGHHIGKNCGQVIAINERRMDLQEIVPDGNQGWEDRLSSLALAE